MSRRVPDRGDVIWLQFDPQAGREQAGHRPALVLSPRFYNQRTSLVIACPMTRQSKDYAFEVPVPEEQGGGVVLADHVKSLDWRERQARIKTRLREPVVEEVIAKLTSLFDANED